MYAFLLVIHIFVSFVLILVILMQAGRGGGVSEVFGGSSTRTIFGTSAGKFLMRATAVCAILFIVTSLALAVLSSRRSHSLLESGKAETIKVEEQKELPQESTLPVQDEEKATEPKSE